MRRKKQGPSDKAPSGLSPEDLALWQAVTQSAKPLPGRRAPPAAVPEGPAKPASVKKSAGEKEEGKLPLSRPAKAAQSAVRRPQLSELDRRLVQKVSRGRTQVQATIDLHGMRQNEAEQRLYDFLKRCQQNDARLVLVVTGKGRSSQGDAIMTGQQPGVLKRAVPLWLAQPRFSGLVVGYREAGRRHGGEGALYVQLKRLSRTRPDG